MLETSGARVLGAAVVFQAVRDLRSDDILTSTDALAWLLTDAQFWIEGLGLDLEEGQILRVVQNSRRLKKCLN